MFTFNSTLFWREHVLESKYLIIYNTSYRLKIILISFNNTLECKKVIVGLTLHLRIKVQFCCYLIRLNNERQII